MSTLLFSCSDSFSVRRSAFTPLAVRVSISNSLTAFLLLGCFYACCCWLWGAINPLPQSAAFQRRVWEVLNNVLKNIVQVLGSAEAGLCDGRLGQSSDFWLIKWDVSTLWLIEIPWKHRLFRGSHHTLKPSVIILAVLGDRMSWRRRQGRKVEFSECLFPDKCSAKTIHILFHLLLTTTGAVDTIIPVLLGRKWRLEDFN